MTLDYNSLSPQGEQSPLYASCLKGNIEMVQLLVHHHAAIDQPCDVSNGLYNSTSLQFISCVLLTESPAYSCSVIHIFTIYYDVHHRMSMLLLH